MSTTVNPSLPSQEPPQLLLASRKHTLGLLGIVGVLVILGLLRSQHPSKPGELPTFTATLMLYGVGIGLQLLWVWFVQGGMRDRGRTILEFFRRDWVGPSSLINDALYALPTLGILVGAMLGIHSLLGDYHPDTASLLPRGFILSALWVGVSVIAGACEEIVFRGYLQRQLTAILHRAWIAILLQAVIFGVGHGYQGWKAIVSASVGAVIFGVLAWWRGNIRASIMVHTGLNLLGGLV